MKIKIPIPDIAFMYMEINNWQGMSVRCGVWQYHKSGAFQKGKFERVLSFLKTSDEKERIDEWISDNEGYIYKWMYDLILRFPLSPT